MSINKRNSKVCQLPKTSHFMENMILKMKLSSMPEARNCEIKYKIKDAHVCANEKEIDILDTFDSNHSQIETIEQQKKLILKPKKNI